MTLKPACNTATWHETNTCLPIFLTQAGISPAKKIKWIQLCKTGYCSSTLHPERLTNKFVHDADKEGSDNYHWLKLKMKYEQNPQKRRTSEQVTLFKLAHVRFPPGHPQRSIF